MGRPISDDETSNNSPTDSRSGQLADPFKADVEIIRITPGVHHDLCVLRGSGFSFSGRGAVGGDAGWNRHDSGNGDVYVVSPIHALSCVPEYVGLDDDPKTITHVLAD